MCPINFEIIQQEERVVTNLNDFISVNNKVLLADNSSAFKTYKNKYLIIIALPKEVKRKHIRLSLKKHHLGIKAHIVKGGILRKPKVSDSFFRSVNIPKDVEKKLISYKVKKNLLFIRMPKVVLREQLQDPFLYKLNLLIGKIKLYMGF